MALSFCAVGRRCVINQVKYHSHGSNAMIIKKIETKAAIEHDTFEKIVKSQRWRDGSAWRLGGRDWRRDSTDNSATYNCAMSQSTENYIVATQMLASMVDSPEPTRAEVSDVATAVILGADTVMLSDETANGKHPTEAVAAMKKIILYTQDHSSVASIDFCQGLKTRQDAISNAAVHLAERLNSIAIVAETKSGSTAANIAAHRPNHR